MTARRATLVDRPRVVAPRTRVRVQEQGVRAGIARVTKRRQL